MILTKRRLTESVLQELGIDDVMGDDWQNDANETMDIEFYREQAEPFWEAITKFLNQLKNSSPDDQRSWAYKQGWDSSIVQGIGGALHMIDIKWLRSKYSDKNVYDTMKQFGLNSDDERTMDGLVKVELPYLMNRYLF
jgi:hypothetical protein